MNIVVVPDKFKNLCDSMMKIYRKNYFTVKFHRYVSFDFCLRDALLHRGLSLNKALLQIGKLLKIHNQFWQFILLFQLYKGIYDFVALVREPLLQYILQEIYDY